MASNTHTPQATGQSDILADRNRFFLLSFRFTFWPLFDQVLDHLWMSLWDLLGTFSGLLRFSWEASGSKNTKKLKGFLRFLKMQLFGSLKLLMALLGSSCPLFGRSGPKMGPKMVPKNAQKRNQQLTMFFCFVFFAKLRWAQHKLQDRPVLKPKMDQYFCTKFKRDLQEKPRWAQEGHHEL